MKTSTFKIMMVSIIVVLMLSIITSSLSARAEGKIIFSKSKDDVVENYALVKGGNDLLTEETKKMFKGVRTRDFGFEALTDDVNSVKKKFGSDIVIDKANLEDIMYYNNLKENHV